MNLSRVKAIVRKDLTELRANRMAVIPMIVVPLILCVALPAVATLVALKLDIAAINGAELIERVLPYYSIPSEFSTTARSILYVFINYMFLPFFMLVPVMVSSIIAANSVVGEKERHTLETLLYTPVTNRELVVGAFVLVLVLRRRRRDGPRLRERAAARILIAAALASGVLITVSLLLSLV